MEIEMKLVLMENAPDEFQKIINDFENDGWNIVVHAGGNMPSYTGFYAHLIKEIKTKN